MVAEPDFSAEHTRLWIPHYDLTLDALASSAASWEDTIGFGGSFRGSVVFPEQEVVEQFAVQAREVFEQDGALPEGLTMLRTALWVERRFPHYGGPPDDVERTRYAHALVESVRKMIGAGAHITPSPATIGGIQDKVMNAYDRLLVGYENWGGWRYRGWEGYDSPATYLGPAVWSERDCGLRLAYELEPEWPGAVHMEFRVAKWTRGDFAPPELVQRVDVSVSEFKDFAAGADASPRFKAQRHEAFFEVKWCVKGWGANSGN